MDFLELMALGIDLELDPSRADQGMVDFDAKYETWAKKGRSSVEINVKTTGDIEKVTELGRAMRAIQSKNVSIHVDLQGATAHVQNLASAVQNINQQVATTKTSGMAGGRAGGAMPWNDWQTLWRPQEVAVKEGRASEWNPVIGARRIKEAAEKEIAETKAAAERIGRAVQESQARGETRLETAHIRGIQEDNRRSDERIKANERRTQKEQENYAQHEGRLSTAQIRGIQEHRQRARAAEERVGQAMFDTENRRLRRAGIAVDRFGQPLEQQSLSEKMQELQRRGYYSVAAGQSLTQTFTRPMQQAIQWSTGAAIDFESSFAGVRKTVDATDAELDALALSFRKLATEIPVSTEKLNNIGEAAGQLGIATPHILGFTRTMAELGISTNLTADQAADKLARLATITQMPQDQFGRLGSTVVDLGNKFAATESEIVAMGLRMAGAGKQVGMTEAEILSMATALASVGLRADAGGSSFSRLFAKMDEATRAGGEKLQNFAKATGIPAAAFKKLFEEDAAGAVVLFVEGLKKLADKGGDTFGTLKALELGELRVRDALLRTSNAGDLLRRSLETGNQAWQQNTALTTEAEKRYATTASKLELLKNRANEAGIAIGERLADSIGKTADNIGNKLPDAARSAIDAWDDLPPLLQQTAIAMAGLLTAMGPLNMAKGNVMMLGAALGSMGGTTALGGTSAATGIFANPIGAAFVATAALVGYSALRAGAAEVAKEQDEAAASTDRLKGSLAGMLEVLPRDSKYAKEITKLQTELKGAGTDAEKVQAVLTKLETAKHQIDVDTKVDSDVKRVVMHDIGAAQDYAKEHPIVIKTIFQAAGNAVTSTLGTTDENGNMPSGINALIDLLMNPFGEMGDGVTPNGAIDVVNPFGDPDVKQAQWDAERAARAGGTAQTRRRQAAAAALLRAQGRRAGVAGGWTWESAVPSSAQYDPLKAPSIFGDVAMATGPALTAYGPDLSVLTRPSTPGETLAAARARAIAKNRPKKGQPTKTSPEAVPGGHDKKGGGDGDAPPHTKADETADRARQILARQLNEQIGRWDSYGNLIESVAGRLHEAATEGGKLGEKTAAAKMHADLLKRSYDGIGDSYRQWAEQIAVVQDRMERLVKTRDGWRGFLNDVGGKLQDSGISTAALEQFAASLEKRLGQAAEAKRLQGRGNELLVQGTGLAEAHRQDLSQWVEVLNEAGRRRGKTHTADVYLGGAPGGAGGTGPAYVDKMAAHVGEATSSFAGDLYNCGKAIRYFTGEAASVTVARGNARPDARGHYPEGAVLHLRKAGPNTTGHYSMVKTGSDGQQYLLESTAPPSNMNRGTYHVRMNRTVASVRHRIDGAGLPAGVAASYAEDYEERPPLVTKNLPNRAKPVAKALLDRAGTPTGRRSLGAPLVPAEKGGRAASPAPVVELDSDLYTSDPLPKGWGPMVNTMALAPGESRQYRLMFQKYLQELQGARQVYSDEFYKEMRAFANSLDVADGIRQQQVKGVEAIRDYGREIRLAGRENNPYAVLMDEFEHGRKATPADVKGREIRGTLDLMATRMRIAGDEVARVEAAKRAALAAGGGDASERERARAAREQELMGQHAEDPEIKAWRQAGDEQQRRGRRDAAQDKYTQADAALRKKVLEEMRTYDAQVAQGDDTARKDFERESNQRIAEAKRRADAARRYASYDPRREEEEARARAREETLAAFKGELGPERDPSKLSKERLGHFNAMETQKMKEYLEAMKSQRVVELENALNDLDRQTATLGDDTGMAGLQFDVIKGKFSQTAGAAELLTRTMSGLRAATNFEAARQAIDAQFGGWNNTARTARERAELENARAQAIANAAAKERHEPVSKDDQEILDIRAKARLEQATAADANARIVKTLEAERDLKLSLAKTEEERVRIEQRYQDLLRDRSHMPAQSPQAMAEEARQRNDEVAAAQARDRVQKITDQAGEVKGWFRAGLDAATTRPDRSQNRSNILQEENRWIDQQVKLQDLGHKAESREFQAAQARHQVLMQQYREKSDAVGRFVHTIAEKLREKGLDRLLDGIAEKGMRAVLGDPKKRAERAAETAGRSSAMGDLIGLGGLLGGDIFTPPFAAESRAVPGVGRAAVPESRAVPVGAQGDLFDRVLARTADGVGDGQQSYASATILVSGSANVSGATVNVSGGGGATPMGEGAGSGASNEQMMFGLLGAVVKR